MSRFEADRMHPEEEDVYKTEPLIGKCSVCKLEIAEGVSLSNGGIICVSCERELREIPEHLQRYLVTSNNSLYLQCDLCNFNYELDPEAFEKHHVTHDYLTDPVPTKRDTKLARNISLQNMQCDTCSKTFLRRGSLIAHLRKHDKLTCKVCHQTFKSLAYLKSHKKRHVRKSINNTLIYCEVCKKYFKTKKGFAYHQQKICIQYKCYLCNESFLVHSVLQDHIKTKHDVEKKPDDGIKVVMDDGQTVMSVCRVCGKVVTQAVLPRHMLLHNEDKPFICDLCGKQFKRKHSLQDHIMIEMGMKNYICDVCGMKFLKQGYLNKHMRYHKLNNGEFQGFQCEVCSKRFSEKWRLGVHQRAVHKGGEFSTCLCDICGKQFAERWMVRKHKHVEHNGEEFKEYMCDVCGKKFQEKWMMKSHQRTTHRSSSKKQYCDLCGRNDHTAEACVHRHVLQEVFCELCGDKFTSNYFLKEHVNSVHNCEPGAEDVVEVKPSETSNDEKNSIRYICAGCGEQFLSKQAIKQHEYKKKCRGESRFECMDCDKAFTSRFSLSNHTMVHKKASSSVSYRCDLCEKDFVTSKALENHLSLDKICLLCDKVYPCNDQLKNHVFDEHNDDDGMGNVVSVGESQISELADKAFECKLCGKKFNRKQSMKNHLFAEMNLRRYVCEFCDKSYNYYSHLKEHLVTNHGEKEHICGYCGKDFPSRKRFRDHVTLHSDDKPFRCVCGLSFKLNRYLSKHKKHCKIRDSI